MNFNRIEITFIRERKKEKLLGKLQISNSFGRSRYLNRNSPDVLNERRNAELPQTEVILHTKMSLILGSFYLVDHR